MLSWNLKFPSGNVALRQWLWSLLLVSAVTGLTIWGIVKLGEWTSQSLEKDKRFGVRFEDIQCTPPPGMQRLQFLGEVRYLSEMPISFSLLDEEAPKQLAKAFAKHPWVEKVEHVEVLPAKTFSVQLRFRQPVLAVPLNKELRAVDSQGVLLPSNAVTKGLPVYSGKVTPPQNPAGHVWQDNGLLKAAQLAAEKQKEQ